MTGSIQSGRPHSEGGSLGGKILIGVGVVAVIFVVGFVAFFVWAVAKGEEQSHEWEQQVASTYRSATPGTSVRVMQDQLGEPFLVASETIRGRAARCSVYRVLLTSRELVPYRFCFVDGSLVSKSRSWDDVPSD